MEHRNSDNGLVLDLRKLSLPVPRGVSSDHREIDISVAGVPKVEQSLTRQTGRGERGAVQSVVEKT